MSSKINLRLPKEYNFTSVEDFRKSFEDMVAIFELMPSELVKKAKEHWGKEIATERIKNINRLIDAMFDSKKRGRPIKTLQGED